MGRRTAEFVLYEPTRPIFYEPIAFRPDHAALARGRCHVESLKVVEAPHAMIDRTRRDDLNHVFLQGLSARYYDSDADCAFAVQPLEILQIAIKEWVLVVPLDFQGYGAVIGSSHMVDLV